MNSFAADLVTRFSRLDYSVHCAGILGASLRTHETSLDEYERVAGVNWKGVWLASRAALAQMLAQEPLDAHPRQRGAVVNIASQLGIVARPTACKSHLLPNLCSCTLRENSQKSTLLCFEGRRDKYDTV